MREVLSEMNLESFPKVSGWKGLQLYVPLNSETDYSVTQSFAKTVAQLMELRYPDLVVSRMSKELREKKSLSTGVRTAISRPRSACTR